MLQTAANAGKNALVRSKSPGAQAIRTITTGRNAAGRTFNPFLRQTTARSAVQQGGSAVRNQVSARGFGTSGASEPYSWLRGKLISNLDPLDPLAKALESPFGLIPKRNAKSAIDFAEIFLDPAYARQIIKEARREQQILFMANIAVGGLTIYGAYKLLQNAYHFATYSRDDDLTDEERKKFEVLLADLSDEWKSLEKQLKQTPVENGNTTANVDENAGEEITSNEKKLYAMILDSGRQIWDTILDILPDAVKAAQEKFVEHPSKENQVIFENALKGIGSSTTETLKLRQEAKKKENALKEEKEKETQKKETEDKA
ncbi:hypothetical protein Ddc_16413 [Ditylenchus destructor]|nr:hypothetical protein Ddc_16413 [Ditylenchus destructor]